MILCGELGWVFFLPPHFTVENLIKHFVQPTAPNSLTVTIYIKKKSKYLHLRSGSPQKNKLLKYYSTNFI